MTRDEMKQEIKRRVKIADIYRPPKGKKGGAVCPLCGSGESGDGAFHIHEDTNSYYCYSCKRGGDVIDLYQKMNNVDFSTALHDLGEKCGLDFEGKPTRAEKAFAHIKTPADEKTRPNIPLSGQEEKDFTQYYIQCRENLFAPDNSGIPAIEYIERRGLDLGICCDMFVGFDPAADTLNTGHPTPRLIIPTTKSHYVARRIDGVEEYKALNPRGQTVGVFNYKVLKKPETQEVFVCEGAIDALSFMTVGADAIALNSTTHIKKFLKKMEDDRPRSDITFIIALDADKAGRDGSAELAAGFRRLGISFIMGGDIYGGAKDANEALCRDREAFVEAIETAKLETAARPDNVSLYIDNFMGGDIEHFKQERKTGFLSFDLQTGGLYPGLYVLAAISSLGKTSFALQMADQLAASGEDVLFFSLEMSRLELVSKSLARTIAQESDRNISSMDIRKGKITEEVMSAAQRYKETVGERLSIVEANFDLNISSICDYVRRYIAKNDTRPAVFLDYLQILQPKEDDSKKQRREALDNTVTELKRFSREIDAPVFVISSVNRANYATPIAFESLKESGGIEYSADVVLGMQLQCLREDLFTSEGSVSKKRKRIEEEKKANPRKIELVCLKNRFGISSFSCFYEYFPRVDLFVDKESASIVPQELKKRSVVI